MYLALRTLHAVEYGASRLHSSSESKFQIELLLIEDYWRFGIEACLVDQQDLLIAKL